MQKAKIKSIEQIKKTITKEDIDAAKRNIAIEKLLYFISDLFSITELENKIVTDIIMNKNTFNEIQNVRDFNPTTKKSYVKRGYMGMIWSANIWIENSLKDNDLQIYSNNDEIDIDFPSVVKSKKILKLDVDISV